jgi:hypothetical protein
MAQQPVINQPAHHPSALIDHLARKMRQRSEAVLAPLCLRPRHVVALTVLRDRGGSTQQALAATLAMDGRSCQLPRLRPPSTTMRWPVT